MVSRIKSKHRLSRRNNKQTSWLVPATTLAIITLIVVKSSGLAFAATPDTSSNSYMNLSTTLNLNSQHTGSILSFLAPQSDANQAKMIALQLDASTSSMQLVSQTTKRPIYSWSLTQDELMPQTKNSFETLESNLNNYLGLGGNIGDVKPVIENNHVWLKAGELSLMSLDGLIPSSGSNAFHDQQRQAYSLTNSLRTAYGLEPLDEIIFPDSELSPIPDSLNLKTLNAFQPKVLKTVTGIASWYGPGFHGKRCANGERFNMNGLTAAMLHVPFGTSVRVTNKRNGKSVVVRVTDRGPFVHNRVIDLSKGAAAEIGVLSSGVAPVVVEILSKKGV